MEKQIIVALIAFATLVLGINKVQAQAIATPTKLNVILADVISIDAGAAVDGIVDFKYLTAADYNSAKTVLVPLSLIITSSKNFDVKVKAGGSKFLSGSNSIPVSVLKIKAVPGGTMAGSFKTITLSTSDRKLVRGATKGSKKSLSIEYSISAAKASKVLLGKPAGTYKQTVTYTATAI